MHIAVVIVGFRNASDILGCLSALQNSSYSDFEIVICENGGRGAYTELMDRVSHELVGGQKICIIEAPKNLGYSGAVNVCIAASATAEAWWILNPDTEPTPHALEELVARLEAGDCEAVGSTVVYSNGQVQSHGGIWRAWLGRAYAIGHRSSDKPNRHKIERDQNYLCGASMLIGRRFFEVTGPMREDYFLYCEEVEWCLRAIGRGMRLGFAPEALVVHHDGTSMDNFSAKLQRGRLPAYLRERNRVLLTRDCFPSLLPIVVVVGIPLMLYVCARRGAWHEVIYGLLGFWAGLLNERGIPIKFAE